MLLALLCSAALAGTLSLPPGEDPELWRAFAEAAGVELVAEGAQLELKHEGRNWALQFASDPTARYPLPSPETPERRQVVMELAARLLAGPIPEGAALALEEDFRESVVPESVLAAAREFTPPVVDPSLPPQPDDATPPVLPPPRRDATRVWPRPVGWVAGVGGQAGYEGLRAPHVGLAISGGLRHSSGGSALLVFETNLPTERASLDSTLQRDGLRAEVGYAGLIVGAGVGRLRVRHDDAPRGELVFPVLTAAVELPLPVGPIWVIPRLGLEAMVARVRFVGANDITELAAIAPVASLRVERVMESYR